MKQPSQTLVPGLEGCLEPMAALRKEVEIIVAPLSEVQFNWQVAANKWSIGQCLKHLNIAGTDRLSTVESLVAKAQS